jgi:hypothetical protein
MSYYYLILFDVCPTVTYCCLVMNADLSDKTARLSDLIAEAKQGRQKKSDILDHYREVLVNEFNQKTSLRLIRDCLQQLGVSVSTDTLWRYFKHIGLVRKKSQKTTPKLPQKSIPRQVGVPVAVPDVGPNASLPSPPAKEKRIGPRVAGADI